VPHESGTGDIQPGEDRSGLGERSAETADDGDAGGHGRENTTGEKRNFECKFRMKNTPPAEAVFTVDSEFRNTFSI
jgi:hypothetical protein